MGVTTLLMQCIGVVQYPNRAEPINLCHLNTTAPRKTAYLPTNIFKQSFHQPSQTNAVLYTLTYNANLISDTLSLCELHCLEKTFQQTGYTLKEIQGAILR